MQILKLLFTQDALVNAGAERSHLEILSRFSPDMEVLMVYFYPKHDLKKEYQDAGIRLHFLDIPESYSFWTAISRLVRLIRKEKPDLLVSSLYRADIITRFAALITGVPLVGTLVNDSYGPFARKEKPGLKYRLVYWLDRWTAGIPVHWIANAQSLVDSHVKTLGLKREKISVVYRGRQVPRPRSVSPRSVSPRSVSSQTETPLSSPTGINNDEIMSCEDTGHGEKKMSCEDTGHGISEDTAHGNVISSIRNFISYGRLLERKGFQEAIQAFSEVLKQYPDCTLTIYGEGVYRKELERLVTSLGLERQVALPGKFGGEVRETEDGRRKTEDGRIKNQAIRDKRQETRDKRIETEDGRTKTEDPPPKAIGITNLQSLVSQSPNPQSPNPQSPNPSKQEIATSSFGTPRNDGKNLLLKSDCFIFPSWYEGFSGALVEAMMAGIPIIASDIPMNLEAVTAEINALTFPVKDVEALVQKMLYAIENPDRMAELGKAAKLEAIERFDIEKIAKEYEGVLDVIANQNTPPRPCP